MAFSSGFYNSKNGDRRYSAEQMSAIFDGLITDGIFDSIGEHFAVRAGSGMNVLVGSGKAWIDHTWMVNDSVEDISIGAADFNYERIDAVVLETDHSVDIRKGSIKVIPGVPSAHPVRPKTIFDGTICQKAIAYVRVPARSSKVEKSNVSSVVGTSECPFVTSIVESTPIDALFSKWEGDFEAWFETLKNNLDSNVAANLQNQIYSLANNRFIPSTNGLFKTFLQEQNGYGVGPYINGNDGIDHPEYSGYSSFLSVSAKTGVSECIQVPVVHGYYAYTHRGNIAYRINLKTKVVEKIHDYSDMCRGDYRDALFGVDENYAYISNFIPGHDYEGTIIKASHSGLVIRRYRTSTGELRYDRRSPHYPGFNAFTNLSDDYRNGYGYPVVGFTKNYILFMFEDYMSHTTHAMMFSKDNLKPRINKNNPNGADTFLTSPPVDGRLIDWFVTDYENDCFHVPGGPGYSNASPMVCNCTWTFKSEWVERDKFSKDSLLESEIHSTVFNEGEYVHIKNSKGPGVAAYKHIVGTSQDHYHGTFSRVPGTGDRYPVSNQKEANDAYDPVTKKYFVRGHIYDIDSRTPEIKESVLAKMEPIKPFSCVDNQLSYNVDGRLYYTLLEGTYNIHHVEMMNGPIGPIDPGNPDFGGNDSFTTDDVISAMMETGIINPFMDSSRGLYTDIDDKTVYCV